MFNLKKQVQLRVPQEQWVLLGKVASKPQLKAFLANLEARIREVEREFLHKPLTQEFERGKVSGLLSAYQIMIDDCRAANKAIVKDKEDEAALRELEEELQKVMDKEEKRRIR